MSSLLQATLTNPSLPIGYRPGFHSDENPHTGDAVYLLKSEATCSAVQATVISGSPERSERGTQCRSFRTNRREEQFHDFAGTPDRY
jgi:hypothetical protein